MNEAHLDTESEKLPVTKSKKSTLRLTKSKKAAKRANDSKLRQILQTGVIAIAKLKFLSPYTTYITVDVNHHFAQF